EQLVLDIAPRDPLTKHRAELNRAVDAASDDWILIIRERETIDDALAKEIAAATSAAKAWGFRIRSTPYYAGKPLRVGSADGERLTQCVLSGAAAPSPPHYFCRGGEAPPPH